MTDALVGRVLGARYRLDRLIGSGGMGSVYVAEQRALERLVAVKVIRPDAAGDATAVQRFQSEARLLSNLAHPHVVSVHDFGKEEDGLLYLVMEHLLGRTLKSVIERGPVPWQEATECVRQIALALQAAHAKGIVHRDLKPANVFLVEIEGAPASAFVKVLDFGLAKPVEADADLTRSGVVVGTAAYLCPDLLDRVEYTPQTDLYALGVIWYELLTRTNPFRVEGNEFKTLERHRHWQREPPSKLVPGIPPAIDALVLRLLAVDPARRTASTEELLDELAAAANGADGPGGARLASPDSTRRIPLPASERPASRWPEALVSAFAAVALVFALVSFFSSRARETAERAAVTELTTQPILPIEPRPELTTRQRAVVDLGRVLYHDPILSGPNTISCATCHPVSHGGTTHEPLTVLGSDGKPAKWNTPTTWNAWLAYKQTWLAAVADVAHVIERPLFGPLMAAKDWEEIEAEVANAPHYPELLEAAGMGANRVDLAAAIQAYAEYITPRNAPVDRWLRGEESALQPDARQGADLFKSYGCISCHQGQGLGGNMVAVFSAVSPGHAYDERGQCGDGSFCRGSCDAGACEPSTLIRPEDRGIGYDEKDAPPTWLFKVPSLRNIAKTAPYFHDGSARTLPEAVRTMAKLQLGRTLPDDDVRKLVAFLESLTGELPDDEEQKCLAAAQLAGPQLARR